MEMRIETVLQDHAKWLSSIGKEGECADLSGADLFCANLTGANLNKANLFCANLTGANLSRADLTGANLNTAIGVANGVFKTQS